MLRVGIVGVGHMGWLHARNVRALEGCRLAGVLDADERRAARAASEFETTVVPDADALAGACDAVVVAAPTSVHAEIVIGCLERGLHVLVEKPLAATIEEADAIEARALSSDRVVAVGHVERFNPAYRALAGAIRNPLFVEAHRLAPFVPRSIDVDVIADLMIHDIDILLSAHEQPIERIDATGVPVITGREDIASARITFADAAVANLTASRVSRERMRRIRFFVPGAYVSLDLLAREGEVLRLAADPREWLERGELPPASALIERRSVGPFPHANPLADELADFVGACERGARPVVGVEEARKTLALAAAVRERVSAHLGKIRGRA